MPKNRWQLLLDPIEASEYIGIPAGTLARWRSEGTGPPYFKFGGRVAYEKKFLDEWMKAQFRAT
jgi:predicted site-specific integrase-resolvase